MWWTISSPSQERPRKSALRSLPPKSGNLRTMLKDWFFQNSEITGSPDWYVSWCSGTLFSTKNWCGRIPSKVPGETEITVELKRQGHKIVPLHVQERLEKLLAQLMDTDIIRELKEDYGMGSLFVNPIIRKQNQCQKQVLVNNWSLLCLSSISTVPRNTNTNQFYIWRKSVHLKWWILWFMWTSKLLEATCDDTIWSP